MARIAIVEHEVWLKPAERRWLTARIMSLLAHFWIAELGDELQTLIAADFIDALSPYPRWAVQQVCRDVIASARRTRPTPGDLVQGCRELTARQSAALHNLRRLVDPVEQERARKRSEAARRRAEEIAAWKAERERAFALAEAWRAENFSGTAISPRANKVPSSGSWSRAELKRVMAETQAVRERNGVSAA